MPTVAGWTFCAARCSSRARPRTPARARWSPGSAGGWRARGVGSRRSRRRTCRNNSVVTADGGEIGRAQAMQAARVRARAERRDEPGAAQAGQRPASQVVVLGRAAGHGQRAVVPRAQGRAARRRHRDPGRPARRGSTSWSARAPASPAEINLRASDFVEHGPGPAADLPVVVVGDIDRGGVFAHLFGTVALLDAGRPGADRGLRHQQVPRRPGPARAGARRSCAALTGRPTLGVLPWADGLWLDAEDSLSAVTDGVLGRPSPPHGSQWLRVAVVRLPRISNATDVEALACEPGVRGPLRHRAAPGRRRRPGRAARVEGDRRGPRLAAPHRAGRRGRRRTRGRAGRCSASAAATRCSGELIADPTGSRRGSADGLGLLPGGRVRGREGAGARSGRRWGHPVRGYEIHHGRVVRSGDAPPLDRAGEGSGVARASSSARTGTGCWRTTGSAARCSPASPSRPAAPGSAPHRTRRSPPSGPRSSTCSATWSRSTSTPRQCAMSSVTARRRVSRR